MGPVTWTICENRVSYWRRHRCGTITETCTQALYATSIRYHTLQRVWSGVHKMYVACYHVLTCHRINRQTDLIRNWHIFQLKSSILLQIPILSGILLPSPTHRTGSDWKPTHFTTFNTINVFICRESCHSSASPQRSTGALKHSRDDPLPPTAFLTNRTLV